MGKTKLKWPLARARTRTHKQYKFAENCISEIGVGVLHWSTSLQFGLALENIYSNDDNFSYDRTPQFYPSDSNSVYPHVKH